MSQRKRLQMHAVNMKTTVYLDKYTLGLDNMKLSMEPFIVPMGTEGNGSSEGIM